MLVLAANKTENPRRILNIEWTSKWNFILFPYSNTYTEIFSIFQNIMLLYGIHSQRVVVVFFFLCRMGGKLLVVGDCVVQYEMCCVKFYVCILYISYSKRHLTESNLQYFIKRINRVFHLGLVFMCAMDLQLWYLWIIYT